MYDEIGENKFYIEKIEREIVNKKLKLLDEAFTFNESEFNLKYLEKLNKFLFRDFHKEEEIGLRNLDQVELAYINKYLDEITRVCIFHNNETEYILEIFKDLWRIQPFNNGNTRTLIGFLKVLKHAFLLNLEINLNKEIKSGEEMFDLNNIVNQKRLTKHK